MGWRNNGPVGATESRNPAPQAEPPQRRPAPLNSSSPVLQKPFPEFAYRRGADTRNKRVAPLRCIYEDLQVNIKNIGRDVKGWSKKRPAEKDDFLELPRLPNKKGRRGGREEWHATEPVLRLMHKHRMRPP